MMVRRAIGWVVYGAGVLSGLSIVGLMVVMSIEVFCRYVLGHPTYWALEVSSYLLVATTCLGIGYTLRVRGHVAVEILVSSLAEPVQRWFARLVMGIAVVFGGVMIWYGVKEVMLAYRFGDVSLTPLAMPVAIPMSLVPIGGLLLVIQAIEYVVAPPVGGPSHGAELPRDALPHAAGMPEDGHSDTVVAGGREREMVRS